MCKLTFITGVCAMQGGKFLVHIERPILGCCLDSHSKAQGCGWMWAYPSSQMHPLGKYTWEQKACCWDAAQTLWGVEGPQSPHSQVLIPQWGTSVLQMGLRKVREVGSGDSQTRFSLGRGNPCISSIVSQTCFCSTNKVPETKFPCGRVQGSERGGAQLKECEPGRRWGHFPGISKFSSTA